MLELEGKSTFDHVPAFGAQMAAAEDRECGTETRTLVAGEQLDTFSRNPEAPQGTERHASSAGSIVMLGEVVRIPRRVRGRRSIS